MTARVRAIRRPQRSRARRHCAPFDAYAAGRTWPAASHGDVRRAAGLPSRLEQQRHHRRAGPVRLSGGVLQRMPLILWSDRPFTIEQWRRHRRIRCMTPDVLARLRELPRSKSSNETWHLGMLDVDLPPGQSAGEPAPVKTRLLVCLPSGGGVPTVEPQSVTFNDGRELTPPVCGLVAGENPLAVRPDAACAGSRLGRRTTPAAPAPSGARRTDRGERSRGTGGRPDSPRRHRRGQALARGS